MSTTKVQARKPVAPKHSFTSPTGVTYSLELVTPDMAETWLGHNVNNRSVRKSGVNALARDMESDAFMENGDAICFDVDGNLIDGQHRLMARVQSSTTGWMLVVRNLAPAVQDTKDDGKKRTMADTFAFHGIENNSAAAAVTRRVILWQNGIRANSGGNYVPTKAEQNELWRTDPTLRSAVEATVTMGRRALLPPSIVGLTWWLFSNISVEDCTAFWYGVSTGANLEPGSPILLLRERVTKAIGEPGRIPESHLLAWTIKAWNLWRQGRTLSTNYRGFALKPLERFPEPR